jgi:hypothetical protein
MPNFGMFPQQETLLAQTTITATGTQALAQALPPASSYRIICQVNSVSGTSPTLVMAVCTSFDGGTTYNSVVSTSTMTTTGQGQQLLIRPYLGIGDAATNAATALVGTATLAAATVNNGPINPQNVQLQFVAGGTSPSFSVKVGVIAVPQDLSD